MSTTEGMSYRCQACGSNDFRGLVRHGSYILRCRSCGTYGAVTSFMAIGPGLCANPARAVVIDEDWNVLELVAEGSGTELYEKVRAVASTGKLVALTQPGTAP